MALFSRFRFVLALVAVRSSCPTHSLLCRGQTLRAHAQGLMTVTACLRKSSSIAESGEGLAIPQRSFKTIEFEPLHESLSNKLKSNELVPIKEVNSLFRNINSLEQLEMATRLLEMYKKSPWFSWHDRTIVIIYNCLKLNAPNHAMEILADKARYGIFPSKNATIKLLRAFAHEHNVEGVINTIQMMKDNNIALSGYAQLILVRTQMSAFVKRYSENITTATETTPTLEDLKLILKLCEDCREENVLQGNLSYYFVNGKLLTNKNLVPLSAQLLDKIEQERKLPEKLILNLRLDYDLLIQDLPGVLRGLQQMKTENIVLSRKRVPRILSVFDGCLDAQLVQSFKDLKLEEMTNSAPDDHKSMNAGSVL